MGQNPRMQALRFIILIAAFSPVGCVTGNSPSDLNALDVSSELITNNGAPLPRASHSAAWTGKGMIVFGGMPDDQTETKGEFAEGAIYYSGSKKWRSLPRAGKVPTYHHASVWTGDQFLVFGGIDAYGDRVNTGYILDWTEKKWTTMATEKGPSPRSGHSAVWTGEQLIIFGGENENKSFANGYSYDLIEDTWSKIAGVKLGARSFHSAVWTGKYMLIWGGLGDDGALGDGAIYNPSTNMWKKISAKNSPKPRYGHSTIWTGTHLIVWGGKNSIDKYRNDGARYDPEKNLWSKLPAKDAPSARELHSAIWTGTNMAIWGGYGADGPYQDGAIYNPASNSWRKIQTGGQDSSRYMHSAVWSGENMLVFGGRTSRGRFINDNRGFSIPMEGTMPTDVFIDDADESEDEEDNEDSDKTDESSNSIAESENGDTENDSSDDVDVGRTTKMLQKRHRTRNSH